MLISFILSSTVRSKQKFIFMWTCKGLSIVDGNVTCSNKIARQVFTILKGQENYKVMTGSSHHCIMEARIYLHLLSDPNRYTFYIMPWGSSIPIRWIMKIRKTGKHQVRKCFFHKNQIDYRKHCSRKSILQIRDQWNVSVKG